MIEAVMSNPFGEVENESPRTKLPTEAELAEHVRNIREQADAADHRAAESERQDWLAFASTFDEQARTHQERFTALPCGGETSRVHECQDSFAAHCGLATQPSCPRRIIAFDREREDVEREDRVKRSGVPAQLVATIRNGMKRTEAIAAVDEFIAESKHVLVLAGGVGTGKSVAASYAIWRKRGLFIHASKLLQLSLYDAEDKELMRRAESTPLLVIDDVGSGIDTKGRAEAAIDALVVCRYDKALTTIITTNRSAAQFREHAGERVVDRIRGNGRFIVLGGASMRRNP